MRHYLSGALFVSGWWFASTFAADSAARPTPPLPPAPAASGFPDPSGRPSSALPSSPAVRKAATGVTRTNQAVARPGGASVRSSVPVMSLSDPSTIPGLVPATVVGPPVPLAPQQPARPFASPLPPPTQETVFAYDALVKETTLKPGETTAYFTFNLTNTSPGEVTINAVRTSCGCTVAKLPSVPWKIPSKAGGAFDVSVDVRGKSGVLTKTITVDSTSGYRYLTVRVSIPASASPMAAADRARNLQVALADRQAVFKGDCAACHLSPAMNQYGETLFKNACGVCHEAEHRASMVPNLHALNKPTDRDYWKSWITKSKTGTLMPAWSIDEGGPLTERQIDSLLDFLTGPFKTLPAPKLATPTVSARPITGPSAQ
jgi:mono/diheme cytochrome c family protein